MRTRNIMLSLILTALTPTIVVAQCNAGSYMKDDMTCTPCGVNTFSSAAASSCSACPSNTESHSNSTICKCRAGFTGPDGGPCTACEVGTYKDSNGMCQPFCTSNGYNIFSGTTALRLPPAGSALTPSGEDTLSPTLMIRSSPVPFVYGATRIRLSSRHTGATRYNPSAILNPGYDYSGSYGGNWNSNGQYASGAYVSSSTRGTGFRSHLPRVSQ